MLADVKSDTHYVGVQGIIYNLCLAWDGESWITLKGQLL